MTPAILPIMRNTKTYTHVCLFALISLLALSSLFNRVVDPFWYYRDISIAGFNANKPQFRNYERHIKPVILKELKPEAVIFSSSVLEAGIDPTYPTLTQNGSYRSYNFGMAAAWWDRVFCNVVYALDNTDLKTVVIGLTPEPLPIVDCTEQHKAMGSIRQSELLLSFDALKASFKTVAQQTKKPTHTLEGMLYYHRFDGDKVEESFHVEMRKHSLRHGITACKTLDDPQRPAWSYPDAPKDMSGLKYLLQRLVDHKAQVKLVVYPFHSLWMELLMCEGVMERWHYLYRFASVVDGFNQAGGNIELWDFQGMSSHITEKVRNNQMKDWQDFGHFNYEMGDVMLDTLYHKPLAPPVPGEDEFGVLLTRESIPGRFYRFFDKRREFIQNNPWFIQDFARFTKPP